MKLILILIILSSSYHSFGLTLSEVSQLAIDHSESLKAQEMEEHALQFEEKLKAKWQNPQVSSQIGTIKSGPVKGSTFEISITQAVPLSDKYGLKRELAQVATSAQKYRHDYFKNWVTHQALLAVWKMFVTNELLKHGYERAKRFSLIKKYLQTRPRVTIKQRVELAIISSQLIQLERLHEEQKRDLQIALNEIEYWLGRRVTTDELQLSLPENFNRFSFIDTKISDDIDYRISQAELKISTIDAELANKEKRPDIFFGGGYRAENGLPFNQFQYLIVGLNIPIWDNGGLRSQAANARLLRDQKYVDEMKRKIEIKQKNQIALIHQSIMQLDRFPKSFIHQNENAITEAEIGFKQGILDVNTFLLSETQAHEIIDQVYMAWMSYLENVSVFQLMKGQQFKWEMLP